MDLEEAEIVHQELINFYSQTKDDKSKHEYKNELWIPVKDYCTIFNKSDKTVKNMIYAEKIAPEDIKKDGKNGKIFIRVNEKIIEFLTNLKRSVELAATTEKQNNETKMGRVLAKKMHNL